MSTNKHTPGPWKTTKESTRNQFVTDTKIRSADDSVICVLHCNGEANARLISAAPELLEVAEYLAGFEKNADWDGYKAVTMAKSAIAKARGAL